MCGIFGIVRTDESKLNNKALDQSYLLSRLGYYSESRGTHAGGIAFKDHMDNISVIKNAGAITRNGTFDTLSKLFKDSRSFMGHTRFTTVGSATKNENNHPFKSDFHNYAMAHNGTISNVFQLEAMFDLPDVDVETDSFIFSRMLDNTTSGLSHENVKKVSELTKGAFNFTVIDENESIWLIKNNNPLVVVKLEDLGVIAYASTEDIMLSAIQDVYNLGDLDSMFSKNKEINITGEVMRPVAGDIWEIRKNGEIIKSTFMPPKYYTSSYYSGYSSQYSDEYYDDYYSKYYGSYDSCEASISTKGCGTVEKTTKKSTFFDEIEKKDYTLINNGTELEIVELNSSEKKGTVITTTYSNFKGRALMNVKKGDVYSHKDFEIIHTIDYEYLMENETYYSIFTRSTGLRPEDDLFNDLLSDTINEFNEEYGKDYFEQYSVYYELPKELVSILKMYLFTAFNLIKNDIGMKPAEEIVSSKVSDLLQLPKYTEQDFYIHFKILIDYLMY